MTHPKTLKKVGAAIAGIVGIALLATATPAFADSPTTTTFETTGKLELNFGTDWLAVLSIAGETGSGSERPLTTDDGSVDVYLSGLDGVFASGLPIQPDGRVYVTQPDSQPLLPTGTYQMTANYIPSPGSNYDSSQTFSPLELSVLALSVEPHVEVSTDANGQESPVISATIGGSYSDINAGAPAGTWHFVVSNDAGTAVFETSAAQEHNSSDPVRVAIDTELAAGKTYEVSTSFTPVVELAGGLTVAEVQIVAFDTLSGSFLDTLAFAVPIPLWLAIVVLVLFAGLVTAAIVLILRLRGTALASVGAATPARARVPGDPGDFESASLEEMGLPEPETVPDIFAEEAPTKRLPESTTWLLSDVEPATNVPSASEAPTERLDAILPIELPEIEIEPEADTHADADAELDGDEPATEIIDSTPNGDDGDDVQPEEPTTKK